jgi:hypothetical protein
LGDVGSQGGQAQGAADQGGVHALLLGQREYVPERPQKKALVKNAYLAKHAPIVRERMKKAGVRLAAILNTVYADAVVSRTDPLVTPATGDDIRRLSTRIESLEQAIRRLTDELSRQRLSDNGLQQ